MYNLPEWYRRAEDYYNLRVSDLVTCTIHFESLITLESPPFQRFWNSDCGSELDENHNTELRRRRDLMIGAISPGSLEPQTLFRNNVRFPAYGWCIYLPCSGLRGNPTGRLLLSDIALSQRLLRVIENHTVVNGTKSRSHILRYNLGLVWVERHRRTKEAYAFLF